jgi:hypothetical protein
MNRTSIVICWAVVASAASTAVGQRPEAGTTRDRVRRVAVSSDGPRLSQPSDNAPYVGKAVEHEVVPVANIDVDSMDDTPRPLVSEPGSGPPQLLEKTGPYDVWRHAFDSQAKLAPIGRDGADTPTDCSVHSADERGVCCRYVVFAQPASFAQPQFDGYGERSPRKAVIIYEGMAVRVSDDGRYVMRMVVETPPTDVDLRLQFRVVEPGNGGVVVDQSAMGGSDDGVCIESAGVPFEIAPGDGTLKEFGTISLPVMRFRPTREQKKSTDALYWQVEQKGYSPLLNRGTLDAKPEADRRNRLRMIRAGVMEIGSAPETPDY